MLIYRAECPHNGNGPFEDGLTFDLEDALLSERGVRHDGNVADYPTPWNDDALDAPSGVFLRCGAISYEQWCHWFPGQCQEVLAEAGHVLSIYEVPDEAAFVGRAQVLFDKDAATLVERFDPRDNPTRQLSLPLAA